MKVVVNSSPLIALGRIEQLSIFELLFAHIYIPSAVYEETVVQATNDTQKCAIIQAIKQKIINVVRPVSQHVFSRKLHSGEKAVLNLAFDMQADLLIVDDRKARNEAQELGFEVRYTSALIRGAEKRGFIDSYYRVLHELRQMGIYLPEQ